MNFVKDVVAMSNCPPGGYILIGVDNAGTLQIPAGTIDRERFDSARLGDIVRSYVEGQVDLRVAVHAHDHHDVVVILVLPHADGLPLPMSKVGNHTDPDNPKKQRAIFRQGEIPVREGAANVPLRRSHWASILHEYRRQIRAQATEMAQSLLREFIAEREQSRSQSPVGRAELPLLLDMDEPTFISAMQALLNSNADVQLRHFLRKAAERITSSSTSDVFHVALDKWAIFCAQAIYWERNDLVDNAVDFMRDAYAQLGIDIEDTRKRLDVVIRIYAVGSTAVRLAQWSAVHTLALQPAPSNRYEKTYIYSSWIRHAQVDASRANLFPDERGGFLISAARELLVEHNGMRPGVEDNDIPPADKLAPDDTLLNTLCQFDLAYCFVVAAEGLHHGSYYPSSAALKDYRAAPIADVIAEKPDARRLLFPNADDTQIAAALAEVYTGATRESSRFGMWWDMPYSARQFVEQHASGD